MKFLAALAVILALLAPSFAASVTGVVSLNGLGYEANGNISISASDNTYHYRSTSFTQLLTLNVYTSAAVNAAGNATSGSGDLDLIVGLTYFPLTALLPSPPTSWLAYFHADANYNFNPTSASVDITGSAAFVAKVFTKITEIDGTTGNTVKTIAFKNRDWKAGSIQTKGYLKYVTYTSVDSDKFWVNITIAVSAVTGRLSVGGAIITPRNIESYVEIGGYNYASTSNKLVLYVHTASVSASASASASGNTLSAGSGKDEIYFHFDGTAIVDGAKTGVNVYGLNVVTAGANADILDNPSVKAQISAIATGSLRADYREVRITFPAGSNSITYDPAFGLSPPRELDNSGALLAPSFFLALISLIFFVMF